MRKTAVALALALAASSARAQAGGPAGGSPPTSGAAPSAPAGPAAPTPVVDAPATAAAPRVEPPSAKAPAPRGAVLEAVSGVVGEVDSQAHRLTVETASGPVTLSLDRNTMIFVAGRLGTVLDLARGQQVRAGRNAELLAYWVQIRAPARPGPEPATGGEAAPASAGPASAGEAAGGGAGPAPSPPPTVQGEVPPGPPPSDGAPPGN
jgi:hypothetical protein